MTSLFGHIEHVGAARPPRDLLPNLLVVEDDADYAALVMRRLAPHGSFVVRRVSRLRQAEDHLQRHEVDCVLLDLSLPDARGMATLAAIVAAAPSAAIVILTGNTDDATALEALAQGAQDYIVKADASAPVLERAIRYGIERKRERNELEAREVVNRAILDGLSSPTILLDPDRVILAVNAAWHDLQRGDERDPAIGADYLDVCRRQPMDLPPAGHVEAGVNAVLRGETAMFELDYSCGVGDERRWYSVRITPCPGAVFGAVATHVPITRLKLAEEELAHLALHDQLTGLPNRRLLFDRLGQGLARARRSDSKLAVVYVDVDHFKSFNDTFGHAVGDAVLMHVGHCLSQVVRPGDTVGHIAGDEFVLLIDAAPDEGSVRELTSRLTAGLRMPFEAMGRTLRLSASVGVATSLPDDSPESILIRADEALYAAKRQGRDRVVWQTDSARSGALTRELPAAIANGELRLYAQAIVAIPQGAIAGHELLIRWQHPLRGLLLPEEFIPEAERSGVVLELGRWVVERACARLAADGGRTFVSVNLAAPQLSDPRLLEILRRARDAGTDLARLCLEITEGAVMADIELASSQLSGLRDLGARVAIDDFGAGQTSLRYLHALPIDMLKIDRGLIGRVGSDDRTNLIVTALVELGRALHLDVIAEGAETVEQRRALEALGCPFGQGFIWAQPHLDDVAEPMPQR